MFSWTNEKDNVERVRGGASEFVPSGLYVMRIISATYGERGGSFSGSDDLGVTLGLDVAEGEHAGAFAMTSWPPTAFVYDCAADGKTVAARKQGRAAYTLDVISACNPGFDAWAAVAANPAMLVGKKVGALMRDTISAKGYHNLRFVEAYTLGEVASGVDAETGAPIEIPPTKDNRADAQGAVANDAPVKAPAPVPAPVTERNDAVLKTRAIGVETAQVATYDDEIPF